MHPFPGEPRRLPLFTGAAAALVAALILTCSASASTAVTFNPKRVPQGGSRVVKAGPSTKVRVVYLGKEGSLATGARPSERSSPARRRHT